MPETLTELFVAAIGNVLSNHHPDFKDLPVDETVDVIAELKDFVLSHAHMAEYGMTQVPIQISFSKEEIQRFQLENVITQCGLVSESRVPGAVMLRPVIT